jgi:hypothetical protein
MPDKEKLEKLIDWVRKEEDQYYDFAYKCLEKNNAVGNMINSAQATAFQRVRYAIEDLLSSNN